MICMNFVNNSQDTIALFDPLLCYEETVTNIINILEEDIDEYKSFCESCFMESEILGDLSEDKFLVLEEGKENIFGKIGNAIIKVFKSFKDFLKKIKDKITNSGFNSKSENEKLKEILAANPDLKNEIIVAWKDNKFQIADDKSFDDLNKEVLDIIKKVNDPKCSESQLAKMWETTKEKFEKSKKVGGKIVGGTIAAGGLILTIEKMYSDLSSLSTKHGKVQSQNEEALLKIYKDIDSNMSKYKESSDAAKKKLGALPKDPTKDQVDKYVKKYDKAVQKSRKQYVDTAKELNQYLDPKFGKAKIARMAAYYANGETAKMLSLYTQCTEELSKKRLGFIQKHYDAKVKTREQEANVYKRDQMKKTQAIKKIDNAKNNTDKK